jgi:hypothetical protein
MTDPLTGAATIVGLSVAAKPALDLVKDFLGRVLAPTGDAIGRSLAHPIVEWQKRRVERASKLVADAAAVVAESGQEPQPVPGRLLIPILEKGSLEDDPELRDRWVALLANAAVNPGGVMPAFVSILGELSSMEARILRRVYELQAELRVLRAADAGNEATTDQRVDEAEFETAMGKVRAHSGIESEDDFEMAVSNLQRLGLMAVVVKRRQKELHSLRLTRLGRGLVTACTRPSVLQTS